MNLKCLFKGHVYTVAKYKGARPSVAPGMWVGRGMLDLQRPGSYWSFRKPFQCGFMSYGLHSKCDRCDKEKAVDNDTTLKIIEPKFSGEEIKQRDYDYNPKPEDPLWWAIKESKL